MNSRILNAIGDSLLGGGKCPYDPACPFGKGSTCLAPNDVLAAKMSEITQRINDMPNCMAHQITTDAKRPWHCENIFIVRFVDPDEEI